MEISISEFDLGILKESLRKSLENERTDWGPTGVYPHFNYQHRRLTKRGKQLKSLIHHIDSQTGSPVTIDHIENWWSILGFWFKREITGMDYDKYTSNEWYISDTDRWWSSRTDDEKKEIYGKHSIN